MHQTVRQFSVLPCSFSSFSQEKGKRQKVETCQEGKKKRKLTQNQTTCIGHFGLKIIDVSDGTPVFCPPLFLFILFEKEGRRQKLESCQEEEEKKLTTTQTTCIDHFGLEIIDV